MPKLADVTAVLDQLYPPAWAESWDAVGTVCGDPEAQLRRVLLAVDPVQEVADEAVDWGADLILTHHPLYLRGTDTVYAGTVKGKVVHTLIRRGVALHVAHTNADAAAPGVSDALAKLLGVRDTVPLAPAADAPDRGIGRVGALATPETFAAFSRRVAHALPATAAGIRIAGDPDAPVRRVAVCGGAGDSFFDAVRHAGADVFLTADLRHHPASEARESGPPALIDAAHWATEWPWLQQAAQELTTACAEHGWDIDTRVSRRVTDPWGGWLATETDDSP